MLYSNEVMDDSDIEDIVSNEMDFSDVSENENDLEFEAGELKEFMEKSPIPKKSSLPTKMTTKEEKEIESIRLNIIKLEEERIKRQEEERIKKLEEELESIQIKLIEFPDDEVYQERYDSLISELKIKGKDYTQSKKISIIPPVLSQKEQLEQLNQKIEETKSKKEKIELQKKKKELLKQISDIEERKKIQKERLQKSSESEKESEISEEDTFDIEKSTTQKEDVLEFNPMEQTDYSKNLTNSILEEIKKQMNVIPVLSKERKGFENKVLKEKPLNPKIQLPKDPESIMKRNMEEILKKMENEKIFGVNLYDKDSYQYKEVDKMIGSYKKGIEIEVSFGNFDKGRFYPGIKSPHEFKCIEDYLIEKKCSMSLSEDNVYYIEGYNTRKIITGGDVYYENKKREKGIDFHDIGIRISRSTEEYKAEDSTFDRSWIQIYEDLQLAVRENLQNKYLKKDLIKNSEVVTVERKRSRKSFKGSDEYKNIQFDLTNVEEIRTMKDGTSKKIFKYEFEIELKKSVLVEFLFAVITEFSKVIQHYHICKKIEDCELVSKDELKQAVSFHNKIFSKDMTLNKIFKDPLRLYEGYWNKPVNLKVVHLLNENINNYSITVKYDGVRKFLMFTPSSVYMCGPPYDITKVGKLEGLSLTGTFLDCELVRTKKSSTVYVFDILFFKGEDVREKTFDERYSLIESIFDESQFKKEKFFLYIKKKPYYKSGEGFYKNVEKAVDRMEDMNSKGTIPTDGIIIQSPGKYFSNDTYKWKEFDKLTIDFLFTKFTEDEYEKHKSHLNKKYAYWISVGRKEVFQGTESHPYSGVVQTSRDSLDRQKIENKIVECKWDLDSNSFVPIRIRIDRTQPNNMYTAKNIWEDIMNPFSEKTLLGKDLVVMRKFHNQVKLRMLKKHFGDGGCTILDIGSGRGGDLRKWEEISLKKIYAVEPNEENMKELIRRKESLGIRNVVPLHMGIQETEKIKENLKDRLDGMVSFFSMTYFSKNKKTYENFINTLRLIPPGGKFIGIVMDGEEVKNDLSNDPTPSEDEGASIVNDAFSIHQEVEFKGNFGDRILIEINDETSMVKKQIEYLFYFNSFIEDMGKHNFTLTYSKRLNDGNEFNILPELSQKFSSYNMSFVFEKSGGIKKDYIKDFETISKIINIQNKFVNPYQDDLEWIPLITQGSSFLHCVLKATSKKYNKLQNDDQKIEYVMSFRRKLCEKLTIEKFLELHGGEFARRLYTPYLFDGKTKESAISKAFLLFKEKLLNRDDNVILGEVNLLELVSADIKKNIFVLVKQHNFEPSKLMYSECKKLYDINRKSIVLIKDDIDYLLVVKGEYKYFSRDDPIISQIYEYLC